MSPRHASLTLSVSPQCPLNPLSVPRVPLTPPVPLSAVLRGHHREVRWPLGRCFTTGRYSGGPEVDKQLSCQLLPRSQSLGTVGSWQIPCAWPHGIL